MKRGNKQLIRSLYDFLCLLVMNRNSHITADVRKDS